MDREDAADGNVLRETQLDMLMREKEAKARAKHHRGGGAGGADGAASAVMRFESASIAADTFAAKPLATAAPAKPQPAGNKVNSPQKKGNDNDDLDLDLIDIEELEELMEELSMEEEIDDEISERQVRLYQS